MSQIYFAYLKDSMKKYLQFREQSLCPYLKKML